MINIKKIIVLFLILISVVNAVDFNISTTSGFDSGVKLNTSTLTDEYNWTSNTLGLSFPYAVKDDNLVNYFRFENSLIDKTNTSTGTASGTVTYVNGKYGKAFSTSSGTNYINYGNASFNETESVTFSAWIYPTTADTYQYVLASGGETSAEGIAMRWRGDTHTIFLGRNTLTSKIQLAGVGNVPANEWTLITGVYNSSANNLKLYINGTYIGTRTSTAETYTRTLNLTVGTNSDQTHGQYPFYGYIDEVKIYNRTLNSSEVSDLYNEGKQYKEIGTWTSENQTMTSGNKMSNTTIEGTNLNISKIQWIRTNDSTLLAEYNNSITSNIIINNSMLTSGSFDNVINDYKIKIFLQDNGSITPEVQQVYGYYEEAIVIPLTHFIIQKQSCYDNDTLQVDTFLRFNNVDTLVLSEFVPCSLGCGQKGVPVCVNLQQEINFSYVGMISIIIAILFFLFSYALSKTEILKTLSITTAIFLTLFVASIATIPGGFSDNFLIDMIEGASSSIYISFALIVLGLVLFSFIFFFISWWRKKSLFQYGLEKEDFND